MSHILDEFQQAQVWQRKSRKGWQAKTSPQGHRVEAVGASNEERHDRAVADDG
jgi:hypothetical protein